MMSYHTSLRTFQAQQRQAYEELLGAFRAHPNDPDARLQRVRTLIQNGAPVNPPEDTRYRYGALEHAIFSGANMELIKLLVEKGAKKEESALERLIQYQGKYSPDVFELQQLLNLAPIQSLSYKNFSDFIRNVKGEKAGLKWVQKLLDTGTPITSSDKKDQSALLENAIHNLNTGIALLEHLVKNGAYLSERMVEHSIKVRGKDSPYTQVLQQLVSNREKQLIQNDSQFAYGRLLQAIGQNTHNQEAQLNRVRTLIQNGAPVNPPEGPLNGYEAIDYAITNTDTGIELLKLLIENGASINQSKLELAIQQRGHESNYVKECRQLLSKVHDVSPMKWEEAKQALIQEDYTAFKKLLPEIGDKITYTDDMGRNLFHYAALHGDSKTVRVLSEAYYKQLDQSLDGSTVLVRFSNEISRLDQEGNSPLHLVMQKNRSERVAQEFLVQGAKLNQSDSRKQPTPYSLAKQNNRLAPLCDRFARTNDILYQLSVDPKAALRLLQEDKRIYRKEIELHVWDQDKRSGYESLEGGNLLHYAVSYNTEVAVIEAILEKGINVNDQDRHGNTSLHYAARQGNVDLYLKLRQREASLDVKNKEGKTPWDMVGEDMRRQLEQVNERLSVYNRPALGG